MITQVTLCGAGTMGSWIALDAAAAGFHVCLQDVSADALDRVRTASEEHASDAEGSLRTTTDLVDAVREADLVIECIPESAELKRKLFRSLDAHAPAAALLTSNTSFLPPEEFAADIREDRFACLHFYRPRTMVEIMGGPGTSPETVDRLVGFARRLRQVPIVLRKQNPGYVLSAIMGAAVDVALDLVAREVVSHEDTDRAWMAATGMPFGPMGTLDQIGLNTSVQIRRNRLARNPGDERLKRGLELLEQMVQDGRVGIKAGRGFYETPSPRIPGPISWTPILRVSAVEEARPPPGR